MSKQYTILLSFLVFFSFNAFTQERTLIKNPTELKKKLLNQSDATKSIVSDFTQEKHVSFMKEAQISKGKFYYQQQNKMRWEQTSPHPYVLLINESKIRIKDNGREKDLKGANKMMGKINKLMIGLINGEIFNSKDFESSYFSYSNTYIIVLKPKSKRLQSMFNTIELTFSKKTIRLNTLTFFEKSGDKSVMKFFNDKFNTSIKQSIFNTL
ncbi:MAG: lipoprotein carrier protein LolA [Flavobacteriales bacterium]|nr:MAG: lipoprotein carrier protein LolA [Flavobacteriales bacterium]